MNFLQFSTQYAPLINKELDKAIGNNVALVNKAARYSLLLPGKRVRPLLVLANCQVCGGSIKKAIVAAVAVEMVHTFSLIHDDLPALDNDDLRRGNPTNHKVFGEAQAILAGDSLLNAAFLVLTKLSAPSDVVIRCIQELTLATKDMITGESADVAGKSGLSLAKLKELNRYKTGRLLEASVALGAIIADAPPITTAALRQFAHTVGELFQLTDDLLDIIGTPATVGKTTQKDDVEGNISLARHLGVRKTQQEIKRLHTQALNHLKLVPDSLILASFADFIRDRTH